MNHLPVLKIHSLRTAKPHSKILPERGRKCVCEGGRGFDSMLLSTQGKNRNDGLQICPQFKNQTEKEGHIPFEGHFRGRSKWAPGLLPGRDHTGSSAFLFVFSLISLRDFCLFVSSSGTSLVFIKLVLMSFSCASAVLEYSGSRCGRIAGLWRCCTALSVLDCVLVLVFRHLGLG